ncbi:kinase-like domain-containing protein [Pilaira anomala]|nr:kinase-like domain-containing protein [Pilaira anomala]
MSLQTQRSSSEIARHHGRKSSSISLKNKESTLSRRQSERHQVMKIQNYVIYRKTIGAGSMGKVKLAECLTDIHKQKYAVKIMPKVDLVSMSTNRSTNKPKDPKDTPEEREQRTIREMAIMRLLRHPNICQLKEYIAEEYVDGGQLLDYIIKHGKLREKQARKFARQIVSALDYCHRNSIVHRDLKIENILITQSEQLKIIDFGLSNVYSPTEQLNTFCGSLYFAAPELLKAKEYTGPEVDVWSFGVVLYVLVCGRVPFDDTNLPALHEKIKSGLVEDYPDHLGKDCLDLLSKIFVVNPKDRITLSGIQAHPWMNKGYEEPIRNYLPHRQPLETIDMEIVQGMHGFGLGSPEEIHEKLQKIVSSNAYQVAALKIDQNFQKKVNDDQTLASRPKWRRTLSTRKKTQMHDDFQSLPAMYDPLVSIYYLVKERRESDERKKQLLNTTENPPVTLSRSTSTLVASSSSSAAVDPSKKLDSTSLVRRRTFDASKKLPELPIPPPVFQAKSTKTYPTRLSPNDIPTPTLSKSENIPVVRKSTLLRQKSLQTMKKFGLKLSSRANVESIPIAPSISSSSSVLTATDESKLNSKSNSQVIISESKRQSIHSTTSTSSRPAWKKMSINRKQNRTSFDNSTGNLPTQLDPMLTHENQPDTTTSSQKAKILVLKSSKSEVVPSFKSKKRNDHPKSLFHFNRAQLFRVSPDKLMTDLEKVLQQLKIQTKRTDQFTIRSLCPYLVWSKFIKPSQTLEDQQQLQQQPDEPFMHDHLSVLEFTVMVYEARWAGGKIGFKLKEDHYQHNALLGLHAKQVMKSINNILLNEIGHLYHELSS